MASRGRSNVFDANGNTLVPACKCRYDDARGRRTDLHPNFDAENHLNSVAVSGQTTQFVYDGDGNLVKKINPNGSKTIYVGGVYEVDKASGGSIQRTVTYYPVAGAMRINSTLYYTLKDHLGSASVVTDASGNILGTQRYYPYGETRLTTGTIYTDRMFTGQREMAGLGIYHYGARFYSPKLGRFLSADTIVPGEANPQAWNRYSYVLGNPLKYTDPSGHEPKYGCYNSTNGVCTNANGTSLSAGNGKKKPKKDKDNETPSPTSTPTSTPCPSMVLTSCNPTATSTPYPTATPTAVECWTNSSCFGATPTPFGQNYGPVIKRSINIVNPLSVSFERDVATVFWDAVLGGAPILGLPASSLNQALATAGNYVVNAAVNAGTAVGNATNNIGWAVSNAFETGVGPTLPIFFHPSNFQSPLSSPTGSN